MKTLPSMLVLFAVAGPAVARGGRGSEGEAKLMLAFLAVFAVGGAVVWVEREFPDFFPTLGGFALIFIASGFIGQIAEGVGLVSGWGTNAVTAAAFLAIVFGLPNLFSRGRWK